MVFVVAVFFSSTVLGNEGPTLNWVRLVSNPGGGGASAYSAAQDSAGNIYVGTGLNTALIKFDSSGNVLWTFSEEDCGVAGIWRTLFQLALV